MSVSKFGPILPVSKYATVLILFLYFNTKGRAMFVRLLIARNIVIVHGLEQDYGALIVNNSILCAHVNSTTRVDLSSILFNSVLESTYHASNTSTLSPINVQLSHIVGTIMFNRFQDVVCS